MKLATSDSLHRSIRRVAMIATAAVLPLAAGCQQSGPTEPAAASTTRAGSAASPSESASSSAQGPTSRDSGGAKSSASADDRAKEQQLVGTWVATDVDAKMGEVKIKLTFQKDDDMKLAAWSEMPFVGQVRDKSGSYRVNGDTISTPAIRDGTSVQFHFDGNDVLVIQYKDDKTVRFTRQ